jgi:hypothetical protein
MGGRYARWLRHRQFPACRDGLQEGQVAVGERKRAGSLDDLEPIYRQLLDRPITQTLGIIGPDGRPSLTPMWFDYADDRILVNTASHCCSRGNR